MSQRSAEIIFWIAVIACAIAQLGIFRAVFSPQREQPTTIPSSSRGAEILWAVIPAIALVALLGATWRAIH